ncbi:hypothetical protein CBR_g19269 [Chara braunii]|uniref:Reverse transcriptase domain-containing protein n=1 Tax=Chara braunii TaxID=69332 RepID=A0A388KXH5_CHABU|nr:hypothetical protein CBR_g19269 [Chara braunii]|eukprot:GBG74756.1 hypothetical protein CBR_g19269 [Chara braunii]
MIHNHRRYAADGVTRCTCAGKPFPKVEGHVHFRLSQWSRCPALAKNAKNVPGEDKRNVSERLKNEIATALNGVDWLGEQLGAVGVREEEVAACIEGSRSVDDTGRKQILRLKQELTGLVLCPLDRNPGETLVLCPSLYAKGMRTAFISNEGYEGCEKSEVEVLEESKDAYVSAGFQKLGKWKKDGRLGRAYALPKHKDTEKFRPICPTFCEPSTNACKMMARCLNAMLFGLPGNEHLNLKAVSDMKGRLMKINKKMENVCQSTQVMVASYDIKDMFSKLPHATIVRAVDWCIWWYKERGLTGVHVKVRGKGARMSKSDVVDRHRFVDFNCLMRYVQFDLENCYTVASAVVLRQIVGIPMGKPSSPPLACLMCAKSEWDFLSSLGSQRRYVAGLRFVDDVSCFVAFSTKRQKSREQAEQILKRFERSYDPALTLKRTEIEDGK